MAFILKLLCIFIPFFVAGYIVEFYRLKKLETNRVSLIMAIYRYNRLLIHEGRYRDEQIPYEILDAVDIRIWDWSYGKRIDPEIFAKLEPFMN